MDSWIKLKKDAIKYKDWELYTWFLKEMKREFSKVYIEAKGEKESFYKYLLKIITCELKENII